MAGPFGRIDNDVVEELLSFCDFDSAILVGRTCRRLQRCSDAALDQWADIAASHRQDETRDNYEGLAVGVEIAERTIADYENVEDSAESNTTGSLRRDWTNGFRSKVSLIEEALAACNDCGSAIGYERANYNEDRARFLLQTRGRVDVKKILLLAMIAIVTIGISTRWAGRCLSNIAIFHCPRHHTGLLMQSNSSKAVNTMTLI